MTEQLDCEERRIDKIIQSSEAFLKELRMVKYSLGRQSKGEFGGKRIISLKKISILTGYGEKDLRLDITTQGFKPASVQDDFYLDDILTFITSRLAFCFKVIS